MNLQKYSMVHGIARVTAVSLFLLSGNVLAEGHGEDSGAGWSGELTASLYGSDGNSQSTSYNVDLKVTHNKDFVEGNRFRHRFYADYDFSDYEDSFSGNKVKTKDAKFLGYGLDYSLNERSHIESEIDYYTNEVGGIDSFRRLNLQYIHYTYNSETHTLKLMAGASLFDIELTDGIAFETTAGSLGIDYTAQLTDKISFTQNAETHESPDYVHRKSTTSLTYALTESSSISLNHEITFHSDVPEDNERTDTNTSLSITFAL